MTVLLFILSNKLFSEQVVVESFGDRLRTIANIRESTVVSSAFPWR